MKRKDFVRHLHDQGCILIREGARHSVFFNPKNKTTSTIPRHNEIDNFLAKKICKDLGIEIVKKL